MPSTAYEMLDIGQQVFIDPPIVDGPAGSPHLYSPEDLYGAELRYYGHIDALDPLAREYRVRALNGDIYYLRRDQFTVVEPEPPHFIVGLTLAIGLLVVVFAVIFEGA